LWVSRNAAANPTQEIHLLAARHFALESSRTGDRDDHP
jgi:hypothetical protein